LRRDDHTSVQGELSELYEKEAKAKKIKKFNNEFIIILVTEMKFNLVQLSDQMKGRQDKREKNGLALQKK